MTPDIHTAIRKGLAETTVQNTAIDDDMATLARVALRRRGAEDLAVVLGVGE